MTYRAIPGWWYAVATIVAFGAFAYVLAIGGIGLKG